MNDLETPGIGISRSTQSMDDALRLKRVHHALFDEDILIRGYCEH